jgi:CheY-like chemotaxis protein
MSLLASGGLIAAPPRAASSAADRRSGLRTLRALIVDDNRHMRKLLHALLGAYGIKDLHEARDGNSGIAMLKAVKPDFVLTDYDMQPVNGIAFVKMVRRTCAPPLAWVPIVMVTAHTELRRIELARDAGITEALCKPVTPQNLYDRIFEIIERPRRFVKTPEFAGPDRRRRKAADYAGPKRRSEDRGVETEFLPE